MENWIDVRGAFLRNAATARLVVVVVLRAAAQRMKIASEKYRYTFEENEATQMIVIHTGVVYSCAIDCLLKKQDENNTKTY